MKTTIILIIIGILFSTQIKAQQRNCATMDVLESQIQEDISVINKIKELEDFTNNVDSEDFKLNGIITIPVVVHVIHNKNSENISEAQINSQITVLNEDFRRLNSDADNTWAQAADTEIEFCLATLDPNNNPTTGITRKSSNIVNWGKEDAMKYASKGGVDAWPSTDYLNIWVCNIGGGILGYAQLPNTGSAKTDGVVISPIYFGNIGSATVPFHLGRTATHEVGHWLNLKHIWGDGGCSFDDFVNDTPKSDAQNYGCSIAHISCSTIDMVQNYMDYSNDACMNLFTNGQKNRMHALFVPGGFRASILNSNACGVNCLSNITLFNPITGIEIIETKDWIEGKTNNVINVDAEVTYDAGNFIVLKPGFKSTYGSKFLAKIDGCETEEIPKKPATLKGSPTICESTEIYTLENGGSNVSWSVSSNLSIIVSTDKEIKVSLKDGNTENKGFVKAILSSGEELSVNMKIGIPSGYQNFTIAYGPGKLVELESKQFWVQESLDGNWNWEWSMNNSAARINGSVVIIKPFTIGHLSVKARLKNECGVGAWLSKGFYVEPPYDNPKNPNFPKNGLNDKSNTNKILVYPNPVKNIMTIVNRSDENPMINLYSLTGKLVLSQTIAEHSTEINISNLPNGVFFLKALGDSSFVQKIIIQH